VLEVARLGAEGVLRPVIHATLPLVEAARGQAGASWADLVSGC